MSVILMVIAYAELRIITAFLSPDISSSDLVLFNGPMTDFEETETGGTRSHPVILYTINGYKPFKISGSSYDVARLSEIRETVSSGKSVTVGSLPEYMDRAEGESFKDRMLNKIISYRAIPRTLFLSSGDSELISLDDYNKAQRKLRYDNLIWGTGVLLVFAGLFIYFIINLWKTRFRGDY